MAYFDVGAVFSSQLICLMASENPQYKEEDGAFAVGMSISKRNPSSRYSSLMLRAFAVVTRASDLRTLALSTKSISSSRAMAKFKFSAIVELNVLMPIISPLSLRRGPPEFPELMGVWVWITLAERPFRQEKFLRI